MLKKSLSLTMPTSAAMCRPAQATARAASASSGRPSARARPLPDSPGTMPSCVRLPTSCAATSFSVPSPPQTTTVDTPSATARAAAMAPSPGRRVSSARISATPRARNTRVAWASRSCRASRRDGGPEVGLTMRSRATGMRKRGAIVPIRWAAPSGGPLVTRSGVRLRCSCCCVRGSVVPPGSTIASNSTVGFTARSRVARRLPPRGARRRASARTAQQAYLAPGQGIDFWRTQFAEAIADMTGALENLRVTADQEVEPLPGPGRRGSRAEGLRRPRPQGAELRRGRQLADGCRRRLRGCDQDERPDRRGVDDAHRLAGRAPRGRDPRASPPAAMAGRRAGRRCLLVRCCCCRYGASRPRSVRRRSQRAGNPAPIRLATTSGPSPAASRPTSPAPNRRRAAREPAPPSRRSRPRRAPSRGATAARTRPWMRPRRSAPIWPASRTATSCARRSGGRRACSMPPA